MFLSNNSQEIIRDFSLYRFAIKTFFAPDKMLCQLSDYDQLISQYTISPFSRDTLYTNAKKFKHNFNSLLLHTYNKNLSLTEALFYERIYSYIIRFYPDNFTYQNTNSFKVTHAFFPTYITTVRLDSLKKNWNSFKKECLEQSFQIYTNAMNYSEEDVRVENGLNINFTSNICLGKIYFFLSYWIDLVFPDKLYELALKVEKIIKAENDYTTSHYLAYNLKIFLFTTAQTTFITHGYQDIYLDNITNAFDKYFMHRKKGSTIGKELIAAISPDLSIIEHWDFLTRPRDYV